MTESNPSTPSNPVVRRRRSLRTPVLLGLAFIAGVVIMAGIAALLVNIQSHKEEAAQFPAKIVPISDTELDPAVWGLNFPREYDSFMKTQDTSIQTTVGSPGTELEFAL